MATEHDIKIGDTPTKKWSLGRDITGATTRVIVTTSDPARTVIIDRVGTIVDAVEGIVSLAFAADDFDEPGTYYLEVETTMVGGVVLTHPDNSYGLIRVYQDLA